MVHETENIMSGRSRSLCTSVDLPEPDGPETMKILEEETGIFLFDVLHLLPQFLDIGLDLQTQHR